MKTIRIAVKEPGKGWEIREVEDEVKTYQGIVGGWLECFLEWNRIAFFCNEDGKFLDLKFNFRFRHDFIMGTVFAARVNREGDFEDLTDEDVETFKHFNPREVFDA